MTKPKTGLIKEEALLSFLFNPIILQISAVIKRKKITIKKGELLNIRRENNKINAKN